MPELPTGTVTFLFTDVEGSTRLWEEHPSEAKTMLARHDEVVESLVGEHGGVVVRPRGEGDSRFAVFARATDALAAALETQRAFAEEPWPVPFRVRIALHTGEADLRAGDYYGPAVNRCARIRAIAHGGQTLVSGATEELVGQALPDGARLRDLGAHRLRDLSEPVRVFQLSHPELPDSFPPPQSLDALPNNLPVQLTSLVGRDAEIREVRDLVAGARLVTLTGAAGCGKTRLALAVGAEELESFPDGIWFVDLAPLGDPDLVPGAIAQALGIREETGRDLDAAVIDFLRRRRLLLLLDNCEHLLAACARAATDILRACADVKVLATGRESLGVAGETAWRVPSLSLPAGNDGLEELSASEAARLFVYRARAAAPSLALGDGDAPAIAQICSRLDGIPLAIELAAALSDVLAPEQIAGRLDDRFGLLTGGSRTALERQQTLRAALDWSHALLSPEEQALFRRLSVFVGGFALEACEDVCSDEPLARGAVLGHLTSLVRKSLVVAERSGRETRYRLLETMRQYAREKLADVPEAPALRARHRDHYLALAERAEPAMRGPDQLEWFERLDLEHENVRAALGWSTGQPGGGEAAHRIAVAMWTFWRVRGHLAESARWFDSVLELPTPEAALRAKALVRGGLSAWYLGSTERARARVDEGLRLAVGAGDPLAEASARLALADLTSADDAEAAAATYARCKGLFEAAGSRWGVAAALRGLARLPLLRDDYATARRFHEEAIAIYRAEGDAGMVAATTQGAAPYLWIQGDLAAVRALAEEALGVFRRLGHRSGIAACLVWLSGCAWADGDSAGARRLIAEATDIHRDLGGGGAVALHLLLSAAFALGEGDLERARAVFGEAEAALPPTADTLEIVVWVRGGLARSGGDAERAAEVYREALRRNARIGNRVGVLVALEGLAGLAVDAGLAARAARLFGAARRLREEVGAAVDPLMRRAVEGDIAAARAALGEEAFEQEHEPGRAMTQEEAVAFALGE